MTWAAKAKARERAGASVASGKTEPVTFEAAVSKVTTLADGGIRITFDLPEDAIIAAAWLMECKREGVVLQVTCKPS